MTITKNFRSYTAGFVDGNSSMQVLPLHTKRGTRVYQVSVQVTCGDRTVLYLLKRIWRIGRVQKIKLGRSSVTASYFWRINSAAELLALLAGILPYLHTKKKHAELLQKFVRTMVKRGQKHKSNARVNRAVLCERFNVLQRKHVAR